MSCVFVEPSVLFAVLLSDLMHTQARAHIDVGSNKKFTLVLVDRYTQAGTSHCTVFVRWSTFAYGVYVCTRTFSHIVGVTLEWKKRVGGKKKKKGYLLTEREYSRHTRVLCKLAAKAEQRDIRSV